MKILFVTEHYYPFLSGVPVVVQYLAEGLAQKHNVSIATSIHAGSSLSPKEKLNGVEVNRFVLYFDLLKRVRGEIAAFQAFVVNGNYDVIIDECAQTCTTDALLPILGQIRSRLVLHAHGLSGLSVKPFMIKNDLKHTLGNTYYWLLMKYYYGVKFKRIAHYFTASISLSRVDSGYNYLSSLIRNNYVLGNAADDIFFDDYSIDKYKLPCEGRQYILSIANYVVVKNQVNMLRQFYKIKHTEVALVMIGSRKTEYYYQLIAENEKLSKKYGARPIYILTEIERCFFPQILDNALLYLVSSSHEEFSISIIEAMARGVPFVSTDVGNAKLLPGGVVCKCIEDFPNTIDKLISNNNKRTEMGKAAKEYAHNHCKREVAIEKLESYLNEILYKF